MGLGGSEGGGVENWSDVSGYIGGGGGGGGWYVKDGFLCSAVGDVVVLGGSPGAGSGTSGTLPMLLFPYAGVEKVRLPSCAVFVEPVP